jgi:hypothetical protein
MKEEMAYQIDTWRRFAGVWVGAVSEFIIEEGSLRDSLRDVTEEESRVSYLRVLSYQGVSPTLTIVIGFIRVFLDFW